MNEFFEKIQSYIADQPHGLSFFLIGLGLFCIISSYKNWDWIYDGPYNPVKNPLGYWFGRKAFRIQIFILGIMLLAFNFLFW